MLLAQTTLLDLAHLLSSSYAYISFVMYVSVIHSFWRTNYISSEYLGTNQRNFLFEHLSDYVKSNRNIFYFNIWFNMLIFNVQRCLNITICHWRSCSISLRTTTVYTRLSLTLSVSKGQLHLNLLIYWYIMIFDGALFLGI